MGMILTLQEQRLAGDAADKVGGYSELIRLERERRRAKGNGHVTKDGASGRFIFSAAAKPKG